MSVIVCSLSVGRKSRIFGSRRMDFSWFGLLLVADHDGRVTTSIFPSAKNLQFSFSSTPISTLTYRQQPLLQQATMGNSSSTEAATGSSDAPLVTGVSISSKLQAKIVEEYNAKVHAEFMQRNANRKRQEEANAQMQSEHEKYLGDRKAVHDQLDQRISDLNAKFKDTLIATDYDASALHEKYVKAEQVRRCNK